MKILFLTSEVAPFSRTGGLADVSKALPKALKSLGHEVRLITPRYRSIRERRHGLREVARLRSLDIEFGGEVHSCAVKSGFIPGAKVQVYFLESERFFNRWGLYGDPETGADWPDNHLRFAFLCHASLQLIQHLRWFPDIIHCNDWQTALVPYLLSSDDRYAGDFTSTRSVLHLHNITQQGLFPLEAGEELGLLNSNHPSGHPLEHEGKLSFLKGGVSRADLLVTVSPAYAAEIKSRPELGRGLEGLFSDRAERLFGVLGGVDDQVWNPAVDSKIPFQYGLDDFIEGKALNKAELQKRFDLPAEPDVPLIGMTSAMLGQEGLDLLREAEPVLFALPIQFVFLGSGEAPYEDMLKEWTERHPVKSSVKFQPDDELEHLIEAGADILLIPSRHERSGLNQMRSMLYGTVPVVGSSGGLADAVIDYTSSDGSGNGFVFAECSAEALVKALERALDVFADREKWHRLQRQGMETDFSWTRAASRLVELYERAMSFNSGEG